MLDRRRVVQGGLAAASLSLAPRALAQPKPQVKIRYNEVVRSILYAPAYVAIAKGYFTEAGLDVSMTTAQGGDKSMAALLSGGADLALMGPETAVYVLNSDSPTKARIFCGLTATDGFMLVGREKVDRLDWKTLKGKRDAYIRRLNGIYERNLEKDSVDYHSGFARFKSKNELEVWRAEELAKIESEKFKHMIASIGSDTIRAMAEAGPAAQAKLLQSLGVQSFLITDGHSPINLFQTAQGLISAPK